MWIDRWTNSDEEFNLDSYLASHGRLRRGAGRGCHTRTDQNTYSGSYHRAASPDFHACADPGTYLDSECAASLGDCDARRDRHTCTDLNIYSDCSAGGLLARR